MYILRPHVTILGVSNSLKLWNSTAFTWRYAHSFAFSWSWKRANVKPFVHPYIRAHTSQIKWITSGIQTFPKWMLPSPSRQFIFEHNFSKQKYGWGRNTIKNSNWMCLIVHEVNLVKIRVFSLIFQMLRIWEFQNILRRWDKNWSSAKCWVSNIISGVQGLSWLRHSRQTDGRHPRHKVFSSHSIDVRLSFRCISACMQCIAYPYFSSLMRRWERPGWKEIKLTVAKHAPWCHELMFWEKVCHLSSSISKCVLNLCVT